MTYTALDNVYWTGVFKPREAPNCSWRWLPMLVGVVGVLYSSPALPTLENPKRDKIAELKF